MHRSTALRRTSAVAMLAVATSAFAQTDRFWIAPIIGTWDTSANWSLTSGGAAGGGLPADDDIITFSNRSTCVFTTPGPFPADFDSIRIRGVGSGTTQLLHSAGTLSTGTFNVGDNASVRNTYTQTGGTFIGAFNTVGLNGGEGRFETSDDAVTNAFLMSVGAGDATGELILAGAEFTSLFLDVSSTNFVGSGAGLGSVEINAGTNTIDTIQLGVDGPATLDFNGGTLTTSIAYEIGLNAQESVATHNTGSFANITGDLIVGSGGAGALSIRGGDIQAGPVSIGSGSAADGLIDVFGGQLIASSITVGTGGDAFLDVSAGTVAATTITIGEDALPGANQMVVVGGGILDADSINIARSIGNTARMVITQDAQVFTGDINVGANAGATGRLIVGGGTTSAITIHLGVLGDGELRQGGGEIDVSLLRIGGNPNIASRVDIDSGVLRATTIDVRPAAPLDLGVGIEADFEGGLIASMLWTIAEDAAVTFGGSVILDARVFDVINDGTFRYDDAVGVLSGPVLAPPFSGRLLGSFVNNGSLILNSGLVSDTGFTMNLTNNGTIDVRQLGSAIAGRLDNNAAGTIELDRTALTAFDRLEVRGSQGLTNDGTISLTNGYIAVPNGPLTNNADFVGHGQIDAQLINNAAIRPDPDDIEEHITINGDLISGPNASLRFVITQAGHNSIVLATGNAQLGGTINVGFDPNVPLPPFQTEYELIRADAGTITGTFAAEAILGYPSEIVYEPSRVLLRTLVCSPADLAPPFGLIDLADIDAFIAAFTLSLPAADLAPPSGIVDLADVDAFIQSFLAGCP